MWAADLTRVSPSSGLVLGFSRHCQGLICTPPEALKIRAAASLHDAGLRVDRVRSVVAHRLRSGFNSSGMLQPHFSVRFSLEIKAVTTARSMQLRNWPKIESFADSSS